MKEQEMKFWARVFECAPRLSPESMQRWIDDPKGLKALLVQLVERQESELLNWLGTTTTSATTTNFVAKDRFVEGSKEVKLAHISDNFRSWFLTGDGKIEEPQGAQELRYGDLTKGSVDGPIVEELGGEAKAETTLAELHDLLKKQANGEDGVLLTNGRANIFYIQDISGVLRAVFVDWCGGGCRVDSSSVEAPDDWNAGRRVFSDNS